jgi:hypothetical protein
MSELDKDFEETLAKINAKLAESAQALKEATEMASKIGFEGLIWTSWSSEEFYNQHRDDDESVDVDALHDEMSDKYEQIKVGPLESAMSRAGWSTSSSYC